MAGAPLFALGAPEAPSSDRSSSSKLLVVVVFLDMLAVGVGAAVASTRGVFAMARDRRLPAPLAAVSTKYGTPIGRDRAADRRPGGAHRRERVLGRRCSRCPGCRTTSRSSSGASTFGGFALLVVYLLMSIGALRGLADHAEQGGARRRRRSSGIAITGGGDLRLVLQGDRARRCSRRGPRWSGS